MLAAFLQALLFIEANKTTIEQIVLKIESLIPNAPGDQKLLAVRNAIGTAMGVEAQIEQTWPLIAPIFNLIVSAVKKPA